MKIVKYKKSSKGLYKILFDDGRSFDLYEDVILKYELLLKKDIDNKTLDLCLKENMKYVVYYTALKSINSRIKSIYDLKEVLKNKGFAENLIDECITLLIKQKYLDDRVFARSFINNQIITTVNGPLKIKNELYKHKVDINIVEDEIELFDEEIIYEKINKVINKMIKSNHTRGGSVLKNKIYSYLVNLGYDSSMIQSSLSKYSFSNNKDIAKHEYDKLYRTLSRKYSGKELEYKIKEKMYQKGLSYED